MNIIDEKIITAGIMARAAYSGVFPEIDCVLFKTVKSDSGFDAKVFIDNNNKEIWVGIAGTSIGENIKDILAYADAVSIFPYPKEWANWSLNSQHYKDAIKFGNELNIELKSNPLYSDYSIKVVGHSWGAFEAQILSYVFGWSGWGLDGPGAYGLIKSDRFSETLRELQIIPVQGADFYSYSATMIGTIGENIPGTVLGKVVGIDSDFNSALTISESMFLAYKLSVGLSASVESFFFCHNIDNINKHIAAGSYVVNIATITENNKYVSVYAEELVVSAPKNDIKNVAVITDEHANTVVIDSSGHILLSQGPDDVLMRDPLSDKFMLFRNDGSKEYLDPLTGTRIYQGVEGSGYLEYSNGTRTSFGFGGLTINPDGSIHVQPSDGSFGIDLFKVSSSFELNTTPDLANQQSGADDPTFAVNTDNSTLYRDATMTISGVGNVNTAIGNVAYANAILSDDYRPGANEIWSSSVSLANGDFSITNINNIVNGSASTGAFANLLASGSALWTPVDPLVLDLNGDGVNLTSFAEAPVLFDIDHDGLKELTGWTTSADGIVVMDLNNNGQIDGIHETFSEYFNGIAGSSGEAGSKPFSNGFSALKSLDSNGDNRFTALDTAWTSVKVWQDADHDGETDSGEIKTLAELGITSIDLSSAAQSGLVNGGNEILATGSFVQNGETKEAQAARFIANPIGSSSTTAGGGTTVSAEDGQSTYVSDATAGEIIDVTEKGVKNAYGNSSDDTLIGDGTDNWLVGGQGSDTFNAGAGDDMLIIDAADLPENIHAGDGFDMLQVVGSDGVCINLVQSEVEVAVGGQGDDFIIGGGRSSIFVQAGDGDDIVIGGAANDSISGQNGADMIDGGAGNDVIRGGRGADMLMGGVGDDLLEGGMDDDSLSGGDGDDILKGGQGDDTLDGSIGIDIAEFSGSFADYRIIRLTDSSYRIVDSVSGRDGADILNNIEKLDFADISAVDITLDNPIPVKDVLTIADRTGTKLINVAALLANDCDWQGDSLHLTTINDLKGGTIAGTYNAASGEWTPVLTSSGELQFTPDPSYTGVMSFKYKIADSDGTPGATVSLIGTANSVGARGQVFITTPDMPTDNLFTNEWYLNDIDVLPVWKDYSGKGVTIGQFEPGMPYSTGAEVFDYRHPDLQASANTTWLSDPAGIPQSFSQHATLVAGVMVAQRDGEGAVGVAYNASLSGFYVGKTLNQNSPFQIEVDFTNLYKLKEFDVTNNSWGYGGQFEYFAQSTPNIAEEFFKPAVELGRHGLGSNIVMAGGNSRVNGGNTNASELTANRYVIVTGAINAECDISTISIGQEPFSNPGASILVSAPGSNVVSTSSILTNEQGSVFGSDTMVAKGTSFASPIISGVVALMLEANPNLGYRDVQQILALSAKQVNDPNTVNSYNGATYWNGGGMHVSYDYGFGEVDARTAVRLAETWLIQHTAYNERHLSNGEGSVNGSGTLGLVIADGATVTRTLSLGAGLCAEHVEVTIDMLHSNYNDLTVELVSPTGTVSRLVANPGQNSALNQDMQQLTFTFDTTRDWGENVQGNWQLRISDRSGIGSGMLNGWKVDAYGSDLNERIGSSNTVTGEAPVISETGDNTYFFTDEFASSPGFLRTTITDTNGGIDTINAAAVSTGSTINLTNGLSSTVAGRSLILNGDIEFAFGGDGNDTITGSVLSNRIEGGRGSDVIDSSGGIDLLDGGEGNDILKGGAGADFFVIRPAANSVDTINDFSPGLVGEKILLVGFDVVTDFSQITVTAEGGNTRLNIGNNQSVVLENVVSSAISEQNFGFFSDSATLEKYVAYLSNIMYAGSSGVEYGLLPGNFGDMRYFALGGSDVVGAITAHDLIDGGDGDDTLWGDYQGYTLVPGADWLEGGAGNDILYGGEGRDVLFGGSGHDSLYGEAGDDVLRGATGDDVLFGADGNDALQGGTGSDYLDGGAGNDLLFLEGDWGTVNGTSYAYYGTRVGGAGADTFLVTPNGGGDAGFMASGTQFSACNLIADFNPFQAGEVIDLSRMTWIRGFSDLSFLNLNVMNTVFTRIAASSGSSELFINLRGVSSGSLNASHFTFASYPGLVIGTTYNDILTGDAGGNTLDGGAGADVMTGRTGDDTYIVDNGGDTVNELPDGGFDTVQSSVSCVLAANIENLVLTGDAFISGTGNDGPNRLTGNGADNILDGASGADTMLGGAGNDTFMVENQSDKVIEHAGEGMDCVQASVSFTLGDNIENLTLTGSSAINATGNAQVNLLTGNTVENILDGGKGADMMAGGAGDDTYIVDNAGDSLSELIDEGEDTVYASTNYTLSDNVENLVLAVGATTGTGNELDNWIEGNIAPNMLSGGAGNDILDGGGGVDSLIGGTGNDTYLLDDSGDTVVELSGEGTDTIMAPISIDLDSLPYVERVVLTGIENINATGNASDNQLEGNDGSNVLTGGVGNDMLDGAAGSDSMIGGSGDDTYVIDNEEDRVSENASEGIDNVYSSINYSLGANVENLILTGFDDIDAEGNDLNNTLCGTIGKNNLIGGAGNDTIDGGSGDDLLVGGTGDDTYQFERGFGFDTIRDYDITSGNNDRIVFGAEFTADQVIVKREGLDLLLLTAQGSVVRVDGWFMDNAHKVERVEFADGTFWNTTELRMKANIAPIAGDSLHNQNAVEDAAFEYVLPLNAFIDADIDVGDSLSYTATLTDGASLPSWLIFDTMTRTFRGTPISTSGGTLPIRITVTDQSGSHISNDFEINIANHITGTAFADNMVGTSMSDVIEGFDGNDKLNGGTGADTLIGGLGNDTYYIDNTGDTIVENPGEGIDLVQSSITYTLESNVENLILSGTTAIDGIGNELNNSISGNSGNNVLTGGEGNDVLNGGLGDDTMTGGLGNDIYYVDSMGDVVTELADEGIDRVYSSLSYVLGDTLENLTLLGTGDVNGTGNSGNNSISGNSGNNVLSGGEGNDVLNGGLGDDTMTGGLGNDIYYVDSMGDVVTELADEGIDRVYSSLSYVLGDTLENLTLLGTGDVNGTGNSGNNSISGNSGNNVLNGGEGNDSLNGGVGDDTMTGGLGNDIYYVDSMGDVVTELADEGIDRVYTSLSYVLGDTLENLSLLGVANIDGTGNSANNAISGNSGNNVLNGGEGNDSLNGGVGDDTMIGGTGNDNYYVDSIGDVVNELADEGIDRVYTSLSYVLGDTLENLSLLGDANIDGTGNSANNAISGNSGNNVLNGGEGNDTLNGGLGDDLMTGGSGNDNYYVDSIGDVVNELADEGIDRVYTSLSYVLGDTLENLSLLGVANIDGTGNSANNAISGNSGNNVLKGFEGNDSLNGGVGDDTMIGGTGNDVLCGGAGSDTLIGDQGNDIYDFNLLMEMGLNVGSCDVIIDFSLGDRIDLSSLDANTATVKNDAFSFIGGSRFNSIDASGQLCYDSASGMLYGSTDSDIDPEFAIQLIDVSSLLARDFIL